MKRALVIGGTSGIGFGVSEILLKNNYRVTATGIEKEIIKDINNLNNANFKALYLNCIDSSPSTEIANIITDLGGLDVLVFSAGIGNLNKDLGFSVENKANQLNVLAFTEVIDATYRFFVKQGFGHLVAVTSFSGLFGTRIAPAYHAAKAYQINYLEGYRQKANKSGLPIYITDVRPGFVETPMTEGKKMIWVATKEKAAKQIYNLIKRKKSVGYVSKRWSNVALLVKVLPRFVRNRL